MANVPFQIYGWLWSSRNMEQKGPSRVPSPTVRQLGHRPFLPPHHPPPVVSVIVLDVLNHMLDSLTKVYFPIEGVSKNERKDNNARLIKDLQTAIMLVMHGTIEDQRYVDSDSGVWPPLYCVAMTFLPHTYHGN